MCNCSSSCDCNITALTKGEKGDASSVASLGYKVYTALLTQSGTDAPVAIVLQNTLGGTPTLTRIVAGQYRITLSSAFTLDKTFLLSTGTFDNEQCTINYKINSTNSIDIVSYDVVIAGDADDMLVNASIEIRVYN
jgi:hypothetical protein